MATKQILVPDIGDFQEVAIIDVYIKVGDILAAEDSVVALESDKHSHKDIAPNAPSSF